MSGRGSRVPAPPTGDEWDLRFADKKAATNWERLCNTAASNCAAMHAQLRKDPRQAVNTRRHHRLLGELGRPQISHDRSSTPSPSRWKAIVRNQLKVTEEQFWEALRTGTAVDRTPPPPPPEPIAVEEWVRKGLRRTGMTDDEVDRLTPEEAQQGLYRRWSGET